MRERIDQEDERGRSQAEGADIAAAPKENGRLMSKAPRREDAITTELTR